MKRRLSLLLAVLLLAGCSNPLGSSLQAPTYHPGLPVTQSLQLSSVMPTVGGFEGGTLLTVNGTGFESGATVTIGGNACLNVTFVSSTQLTCVTPVHPVGPVNVEVINPDAQTSTLAKAFQYYTTSKPVAGFAQSTGGGIATGTGVRLRFTAGALGFPAQQTATGTKLLPGVQGTYSHP